MSKEGNGEVMREASLDELRLHGSEKTDAAVFEFFTDESRTLGYLKVSISKEEEPPSSKDALDYLEKAKVKLLPAAPQALKEAFTRAGGKGVIGPVKVAEGTLPVDGENGSYEWLVQQPFAPKEPSKAGARIDYKERNAFVNVLKDERIISITAPKDGTGGEDVFGAPIPAKSGQPADIRKGKNTDIIEDGCYLVAQAPGYIEISGSTISVETVLVVRGDVDLQVGNIDFVGPVKVNGDVLDGFHVQSKEDIEVNGMVEGALLSAAGPIVIKGGVAGKGKGRIVCKGPFEARYVNDVYIEAAGDVKLQNSVINSTIKCLGRIDVQAGGIRGANIVARNGLKTPEVGSDLGVRTVVVVGVDYDLKDKLAKIEKEISDIKGKVYKIKTALGPVMENSRIITDLPKERADAAKKLIAELRKLAESASKLNAAREAILAKMQVDQGTCIEVDKKILPGVAMQIGTCRRTFETEVPGPLKILQDIAKGSLRISK
jgi:uncharacterized protein (DUF342 family)